MHAFEMQLDPQLEAVLAALSDPHIAVVTGAPFAAFRNALSIMRDLDEAAMIEAGIVRSRAEFLLYVANPIRWLDRAEDRQAAAWWALVQARQPGWLKAERDAAQHLRVSVCHQEPRHE